MKDEELLLLYRKYKKKRRIIISGIIVIFFTMCLIFMYLRSNNSSSPDLNKTPINEPSIDEIKIEDTEAPIIKLKYDYLELEKGDDIDYLGYVESVIDNIDGNLLDKLEYDKIDSSIVGEQNIVYRVSDSSNNNCQKILLVIIREKEISSENNESSNVNSKEETNKKPNSNNNSSNPPQKSEPDNPKVIEEDIPKQENKPSDKIIKYFLFSEGYTMENVADACAAELKKTNKTGMCSPIQDENGIYLGMKLETN